LPGTPGNPNANFMSRVSLSDLWAFAYADVRRDDRSWAWLRDFCLRWNEVRNRPPPALNDRRAPRKRGRTPTKREQTCAKMLRDIEEHGVEFVRNMKEESMQERYKVSRDTARKARREALIGPPSAAPQPKNCRQ
jgi:hypothetical protein